MIFMIPVSLKRDSDRVARSILSPSELLPAGEDTFPFGAPALGFLESIFVQKAAGFMSALDQRFLGLRAIGMP